LKIRNSIVITQSSYFLSCQTASCVLGKPAAPTKLKFTDKTEDKIDISWSQPTGAKYFDINGYIVGHKTISDTQYKTQRILSNSLNLILNNLESDTFYVIKVHGFNDDGDGEHSEIEVKTDPSGKSSKFQKRIISSSIRDQLFKERLALTMG
jgi:hypothetical protein